MNKVRKFYNKDKYFQDGECNYLNILGLALLLKRNKITNITAKKYEDFEHLITKDNSKENTLAKKIIDSMLYFVGQFEIDDLDYNDISRKQIYDMFSEEEKNFDINKKYDDITTFNYALKQSIDISKFSDEEIIEEISRPINDFTIKDYNDVNGNMNNDISKLMISILGIKKGDDIAVVDFHCKDERPHPYNNNGIIENQIILQTNNSNIDAYYVGKKKLNREIREYAVNTEIKQIDTNLYEKEFNKKYDYIIANPEIIENQDKAFYNFNLDKTIFNKLSFNNMSVSYKILAKMFNGLKPNGIGIIACSLASLSNISERKFRNLLIENNHIKKVVKIDNIALIIFCKDNKDENVEFVDLNECIILQKYNCFMYSTSSLKMEKVKEYLKKTLLVSKDEIVKNDYSLVPDTYLRKIEIKNSTTLELLLESIFRGYQAPKSEVIKMQVQNEENANYKLLEIGNINDYGEISTSLTLINSNNIGKNFDRYLLKNGDIVITARGDKIKVAYIKLKENEKIIANGSINVIRVNQDKMNSRYLKMFLDSEKGKQSIEKIKIGKTTPSLNTGALKKIEVPCPTLEEQNEIVKEYEEIKNTIETLKSKLNDMINNF